ncbi:ATPase-AAA-core domain-containing protein [Mycena venus]|uniref:ATPase-AAA-core domain-containing protein n=1 Tax=Mycena venus TaxID=2733690 RepID=A0A8H6XN06_9AGAR|nr:ATPase-AAA-core domain-containing protein [Mycena venus]
MSDQSSMTGGLSNAQTSSNSLSLLPSKPKIFHGRESELHDITVLLSQDSSARIAILGPGGIGKTSLAKAVLHHPAVTAKYQNCFFISCESAHTRSDLITLLGSHLNLQPDKNLFEQVLNFFCTGSSMSPDPG